ncbi:putative rhamnosyl transferase [Sinorhizobium garamanticum]|uniref:Rhamnosyl transferase n=1 Tax=Sinorhizobium garamanticum TaxID=680247 RepID=A0ABY8DMM3_9HYPH|nr:glycosyltransferase [Sinorhizobium garamanticum]WEX91242.1 putative rhamnosyl transferase [Sinorhizobium garamanticum]
MRIGLDHILLTRFNLPSPGIESLIRAKEGWLRERIDLFEQYCLPSVAAQTNQNFRWIVYFDPASPEWLKNRIVRHVESGMFTPIYRESVSREEMIGDIRGVIDRQHEVLITTNLDNDDGIAIDFVDRVQSVVPPCERVAIYVVNGLIRRGDRVYLRRDTRNAFNSVRETWSSPVTSWSAWHTELGDLMPVVEIDGYPGWLQVVHGSNVSNRVRGRLVSPLPVRKLFGRLLDGVGEPGRLDLGRDRLISLPARFIRECGRAVAKRIVLRTLGRDGLGSVKLLWKSRFGLLPKS